MPKLIIGNNLNDHMVGDPARVDRVLRELSTMFAARLAWLLEDGDVLVAPGPLAPGMLEYVGSITGLDPETVRVITPPPSPSPQMLSRKLLLSEPLVESVRDALAGRDDWELVAFYPEATVIELAMAVGVPVPPAAELFAQNGADLLNSKVTFRRLSAGAGLPVPEGSVCSTLVELQSAVARHIEATGSVLLKQNSNAGCDGNLAIARDPSRPHPGARLVFPAPADTDELDALAQRLWNEMTGPMNASLVVEVYEPSRHSLFAEYRVTADKRPEYLCSGALRMERAGDPRGGDGELWVGFVIPAPLRGAEQPHFITHATSYADLARTLGYQGKINIDALVRTDGGIVFNEVNGRLGGCTHIHELATRLLGEHYANEHVVVTRNHVPATGSEDVLQCLADTGLAFDPTTRTGLIVLVCESHYSQQIEIMTIAADRETAVGIEGEFLAALQGVRPGVAVA